MHQIRDDGHKQTLFAEEVIGSYLTSLPNLKPGKAAFLLRRVFDGALVQTMSREKLISIARRIQPTLSHIRSSSYRQVWRQEGEEQVVSSEDLSDICSLHLRIACEASSATFELVEQTLDNKGDIQISTIVQLANSALVFWYLYQVDCALTYTDFPKKYWQIIHKLFSFVCELKLQDYPVIPIHERVFAPLEALYKRILLLDIINPSRFSRREVLILDRLLLSWGQYIHLHHGFKQADQFSLDLQSATGLQYINMKHRLSATMGVDVNGLARLLSGWDHYTNGEESRQLILGDVALSQACLHKLLQTFSQKPIRRYRRIEQSGGAILVQKNILTSKMEMDEWLISNTSAQGYCLEKIISDSDNVAVGQLIQLQEQASIADLSKWNVGVIRWVQRTANHHLKIGIQLLSPQATRVKVSAKQQPTYGLWLPKNEMLGQVESVITGHQYKKGDTVKVKNKQTQYQVKLVNLISQGLGFQQFACQRVT